MIKINKMKKKFFATMMVTAIAGICVMTSCSKEERMSNGIGSSVGRFVGNVVNNY